MKMKQLLIIFIKKKENLICKNKYNIFYIQE